MSWGNFKTRKGIVKFFSVLLFFIYIVSFYTIYPIIGNHLLIVSIIPILMVYWAFNIRLAIIAQIIMVFHRFIALKLLGIDVGIMLSFGTFVGTILNFVMLFMAHYLYRLNQRLKIAEGKLLTQNRDLIIAKNKAEESDRLKTTFISNINHEIRTPLNAIIGFSRLLMEPDISLENRKEFFDSINSSSERLMQQIEGYIEISTLMADTIPLIESEFPLKSFMDKLVERFSQKLEAKPEVELLMDTDLMTGKDLIISDKLRLNQVLNVLIDNAIKFTLQGHVKITYNTTKDNKLMFSIEDTGIGISSKYKDVIFDCFRQGDEEIYTRKFEGSGLGLAISKASLELLGGKIWFTSIPDTGSKFYFTIPCRKVVNKIGGIRMNSILDN